MDIAAIAANSMDRSMATAAAVHEVAMLKKAMNLEQELALQLLQSLEKSLPTPPPSFGHKFDVLA